MAEALPEGWAAHVDPEGRTYYANSITGESSWEKPAMTYAAAPEVAPPYAPAQELPAGWTTHQDGDGRTFYYNAGTGETSWDPPPAAAPAPQGVWSTEYTYTITTQEEADTLTAPGKATLLNKETYFSVAAAVDALNQNAVPGVEAGCCVVYSRNKAKHFLLWRSDKEYETFMNLGIQTDDWWTLEQSKDLGGPADNADAINLFQGKVELLDSTRYCSVADTVAALNARTEIDVPCGYCVIFSATQQQYYLLWRHDKETEALAKVGFA